MIKRTSTKMSMGMVRIFKNVVEEMNIEWSSAFTLKNNRGNCIDLRLTPNSYICIWEENHTVRSNGESLAVRGLTCKESTTLAYTGTKAESEASCE